MGKILIIPVQNIKLDGAGIVDDRNLQRWLMSMVQTDRTPFALQVVATGKTLQEWNIRDAGLDWKASGMIYHTWVGSSGSPDDVAVEQFDRIVTNPIQHNMITGVRDDIRFDTDGVRVQAVLDRQILGNTYSRVNERGLNSGAGPNWVDDLAVTDYLGVSYTPTFGAGAPPPGSVDLDVAGAYAFRRLTFNAADIAGLGAIQGGIRVRGLFLYQISLQPPVRYYLAQGNGEILQNLAFPITEMGEPD